MLSIIKYKAAPESDGKFHHIHQPKRRRYNKVVSQETRKYFFSNGISYHQTMLKHVALLSRSPSSREKKIEKKKKEKHIAVLKITHESITDICTEKEKHTIAQPFFIMPHV